MTGNFYQILEKRSTSALPCVCHGGTHAAPQVDAVPGYPRDDAGTKYSLYKIIGYSRMGRKFVAKTEFIFFANICKKHVCSVTIT